MVTLTIFDFPQGYKRAATQEDIDQLQKFQCAISMQPEGKLITNDDCNENEKFDFKLGIYPNRMRSDGVFVAELKEIEPYEGIRNINDSKCYPSLPKTSYKIGVQLPTYFAMEIVRRWNNDMRCTK